MSDGTLTDGALTLPRTALPHALGAINGLEGRHEDTLLGDIDDLAGRLIALASGCEHGGAHDCTVEDGTEAFTITITVHHGRPEDTWSSWLTLLQALATHGATGAFVHEDENGTRWRTRLENGQVHEDDQVYTGDTAAHLAQLQRRDGQLLDFTTVTTSEDEAFIALLGELSDRHAPRPAATGDVDLRQQMQRWAEHAGLAWTVRPLRA